MLASSLLSWVKNSERSAMEWLARKLRLKINRAVFLYLAAMLIVLAGEVGLTALREVITVAGLPMFIVVFAMMFALFQVISKEDLTEIRVGKPPPVEKLKNI